VARAQRDIFGRSTIAVMGSNRRLDGIDQGAFSADANLFFSRTVSMTAQILKSYGPFAHGTEAILIRPSYDSSTAHFHVRYGHVGNRVAENLNVIGQITEDDKRELDSHVTKIVWVRRGAFEQFRHDSNYQIYWGQTGVLRSWKVNQGLAVEFRNRLNAQMTWVEEYKLFEKWTGSARRKITAALSAEYSLQRLVLDPDPSNGTTWIHVLRTDQFFTKDLFLRLFFQTNTAIDRKNVQAVFVYRYLPPFGTIQLAYQRGTAAFGERSTQGNTLFLKATTVF
jgi:hypothetical protein